MKLQISKNDNKILRWLNRATGREKFKGEYSRPVLSGINMDGVVMATDGFRCHAAKLEAETPEGIVRFGKIPATAEEIEGEVVEGRYPDMRTVIPTTSPLAQVVVDANYLAHVLEGMKGRDKWVRICLHGINSPLEVFGKVGGQPAYALIMPIHTYDGAANLKWKPGKEE